MNNFQQNRLQNNLMGKSYAYGPIQNQKRQCTDAFCIITFIFLSLMIFSVTVYCTLYKGIQNLTTPTDSNGKLCGIDKKQFPYLYFVNPHIQVFRSMMMQYISRRVCVSQCPTTQASSLKCSPNTKVPSCQNLQNQSGQSTVQIYPTTLLLQRICIPQSKHLRDKILETLNIKIDEQKISQMIRNWRLIVLSLPLTIIVTTLLLLLVRYTACFSIYCITFLAIGLLLVLSYSLYISSLSSSSQVQCLHIKKDILLKILAVTCVVLAFVLFTCFICFRKRITIAVKIIKASARFVNQHGYLIFISFVKVIFALIFLTIWLVQLWGLFTFKEMVWNHYKINVTQNTDKLIKMGILVLHVFYLLWGFFFITQSGSFVVSGSVTNWYFKQQSICCNSLSRYAKYHSGSVAAGSFYIALFGMIKLIYQFLKPNSQNEDSCLGKIQKCCDFFCCICVSYIFSVINRGAYAFINIAGRPYCESSLKVLSLRTAQPVFSGVIIFLQTVFSLILRIQIIFVAVIVNYLLIKYVEPFKYSNSDLTLTLIVVGAIAFIISDLFVTAYVQAADTLGICFMVDKQYGQGQTNCPQQLKEYLEQTRANDGFIE